MARGVNKCLILGNLGQDPDVRFTASGKPVANLRVATTDIWTDRQSGQRQERTEWHSIVLFNKLAEIAQQYAKKGSRVYIEGRLQTRKWQDQNGQDRYTTEIIGNDIQLLDSRNTQSNGTNQNQQGNHSNQQPNPQSGYNQQPNQQGNQQGGYNQQGNQQPAAATPPPQPAYAGPESGAFDDFDEVPF